MSLLWRYHRQVKQAPPAAETSAPVKVPTPDPAKFPSKVVAPPAPFKAPVVNQVKK